MLRFTVPGEPAGPGIRLLDGRGEVVTSSIDRTNGGATFVLRPQRPLSEGRFGVAWRVAAPDAHPISGGFTFTVDAAPAPTDTNQSAPAPAGGDDPLAAALEAPDERGARVLGGVGRALTYAGGLFAIGGLAFLAFAAVGARREIARLFAALRLAGLLALAGALVGVVARAWLIDGGGPAAVASAASLGDALGAEAGLGLIITAVGGLLVAVGARAAYRPAPRVAIAGGSWDEYRPQRVVGGSIGNAWVAVAGVLAITLGAALNGHSASEGPRAVVWTAHFLHIGAAGVWFGGLALLVALLVGRRRVGRPANAAYPAVRFATLAGAGSALAGLGGIVLAIIILPSVSALWASAWGLLLLVKVGLVALVAGMGAHNHFRLIPRLTARLEAVEAEPPEGAAARWDAPAAREAGPVATAGTATLARVERVVTPAAGAEEGVDQIARSLRRNATIELLLLTVVVAITAALVGTSAV